LITTLDEANWPFADFVTAVTYSLKLMIAQDAANWPHAYVLQP
jgi:hypothetical protein